MSPGYISADATLVILLTYNWAAGVKGTGFPGTWSPCQTVPSVCPDLFV